MKNITRADAKTLHDAINKAMREVAKQFGLEYSPKNGTYTDGEFRTSVRLVTPLNITVGNVLEPISSDNGIKFGLASRGTQVKFRNDICTVVEARRVKYVLLFPNGKEYLVKFEHCSPIA